MRKFLIIVSLFFVVLGIVFTALPLGTIAFLPVGLAIVTAALLIFISKPEQRKFPKWILLAGLLTLLSIMGKVVFIQDKIETDKQFEQQKIDSKKQDVKDLEGL
jgi:hypothetical protein